MDAPGRNSEYPKTLLLTGASRGIGHATVKRFSAAGWRVITISRQPFSEKCPWSYGKENHLQMDLADLDQIEHGVMELKRRLPDGKLHALVNNAGISPKMPDGSRMDTIHTDMKTWLHVFGVNLFSAVVLARGMLEELSAASGSIVNVTSIAGKRVHPFAGPAYATSKAALAALTREMANDFSAFGIRVNAVSPGEVTTSILSPGTDAIVERWVPMKRLGTTGEVAEVIYFLCSEAASYVNGAEIPVDGGQQVR
ncbi:MAG: SDR family NAD(P)-dependent oxidoreductase [Candidatus Methylomirabilales bacterium]